MPVAPPICAGAFVLRKNPANPAARAGSRAPARGCRGALPVAGLDLHREGRGRPPLRGNRPSHPKPIAELRAPGRPPGKRLRSPLDRGAWAAGPPARRRGDASDPPRPEPMKPSDAFIDEVEI